MIITVLLGAAFAACALLAASGFWRMARIRGAARDRGSWHAPLIFTSAAAALLAALGVLAPVSGALLTLIPLLPPAAIAWKPLRAAARSMGWPRAVIFILGRFLAGPLRDALTATGEDLRVLAGRPPECAAPGAAPAPATAGPRRVPSTARPHPDLGPVPVPAQVAAEVQGVAVPAAWAAVAERFAMFEPENGEDLRQFIAENAAGILTVAESIGFQAEDLGAGIKLDPAFTAAQVAFADDFADTASAAAMTLRAYDNAYDGVHEHVDDGGTLPEDSRGWFNADGSAGQAA